MPKKVMLEAHEITRVNRIRVAKYLGQLPQVVDRMPYQDVADVLAIMRADIKIENFDNKKAEQARRNRGRPRKK